MKSYKIELKHKLTDAVKSVLPDACLIAFDETEYGFFCDYDTPVPLNPDRFEEISACLYSGEEENAPPFALDRFSGVYEDGDADKRMLQRIFVTAFESRAELEAHQKFLQEAALYDHKSLGRRMKLFSTSDDIGQGLILWHPKGAMLRHVMEKFGQEAHLLNEYQWVYTPHIGRAALWETSGHLHFYRDSMYSPIHIDDEDYYLKPMNCPFHINIYHSEPRSYRDLPMRLAEYGTVYRHELSGTLNGLTRVRGFTQDDAHIICEEKQIAGEVSRALQFSLYILRAFGFTTFEAYLSTKPEKKSIGTAEAWTLAEQTLRDAVIDAGLPYQIDEGGGAFYGPKIDLKLRDSLGREWQCSTIQFDFNLPERFHMTYTGRDGKKYVPLMIHRALFGSFERFTALLIEHYRGAFPFWLSPVQIGIVPVQERHTAYAKRLAVTLKKAGLRVNINADNTNMRIKIKEYETEKIPYILVVGDREETAGTVSVRSRKVLSSSHMSLEEFLSYLQPEIEMGIPQYLGE